VPKAPKGKVGMYVYIDEKVYEELKRLAFQKYERLHGALSCEVEQALRCWLALHTQKAHKFLKEADPPNPPRVLRVFEQVKEYLKERHGYVAIVQGVRIPRAHLIEAIGAVRGCDKRTIRKWVELFVKAKLIEQAGGEVYEVL